MSHKQRLTHALPAATTLFVALTLLFVSFVAARPVELNPGASTLKLITELKDVGVNVDIDQRRRLARFIGANRYTPVLVDGVSPGAAPSFNAMVIAEKYGKLFGLSNPREELVVRKVGQTGTGGDKIHYQQRFKGVPIMGGELIVNMDRGGALISMNGETGVIPKNMPLTPVVDKSMAAAKALIAVAKWYHLSPGALAASVPELTIYDASLLGPASSEPVRLVWRVEVRPHELAPIRELVLVDAESGGIALHFNQVDTAKKRLTYSANATDNLPGTLLCNETADLPCTSGLGTNSEANYAHLYAGVTYDFYLNYHGRDSLDDAGATLISTVDFNDDSCPNAYWDGTQMVYCQGFPEADDVVAHELTHAVTERTSNLFYYYQSGAINESLSDLWGEFVDLTDGYGNDSSQVRWKIGEDLAVPGMPGAIRDMKNPLAFQQPDKMSSSMYYIGSEDTGGVHINSGINNKAVYLLTDGATFNGQTVVGLGITKVAKIYYEAQTHLLTSGADYLDLDNALNQACVNLIGGTAGITANDCLQVRAASTAVEMAKDPSASYNPEAQVCPAGQTINDVFFDGFESGFSHWSLTSLPSGKQTWGSYLAATDFHLYGDSYATSGTEALFGADLSVVSDQLATITVTVPVGQPYLHFRHAFDFEQFGGNYYDGGLLQYSIDNGTSWNDAMALFDSGKNYSGTIFSSSDGDNPLKGKTAFVGASHGYVSTRLNLLTLAGQNIKLRWRVGTDTGNGSLGWVLDDVRVYTCGSVSANKAPNANAGNPQIVNKGKSVTLNGSGSSDGDGTIAGYAWEQIGGTPSVTILNGSTATPSFVAPSVLTTLTFRLTVTDNQGAKASATTTVTTINLVPIAEAGSPQSVNSATAVSLNGTASVDSDGTIVSYAWTQTDGTLVTLNNPNSATPSFMAPSGATTLIFWLTVTDNDGATASSTTTVTVNVPAVAPPAADSGGGGGCSLSKDGGSDPLLALGFLGAVCVIMRRRQNRA